MTEPLDPNRKLGVCPTCYMTIYRQQTECSYCHQAVPEDMLTAALAEEADAAFEALQTMFHDAFITPLFVSRRLSVKHSEPNINGPSYYSLDEYASMSTEQIVKLTKELADESAG